MKMKQYTLAVWRAIRRPRTVRWAVAVGFALGSLASPAAPPSAQAAQQWRVIAGDATRAEGIQGLGFYPAEIWVNAADSVSWAFRSGEAHTITFGALPAPPAKPALPPGAPPSAWSNWPGPPFLWAPATADNFPYTGTEFVNSGMRGKGDSAYSVTFAVPFTATDPTTKDFAYRCLLHPKMTGTVHVSRAGAPYPHDQRYYDRQAREVAQQQFAQGRQYARDALRTAQAAPGRVNVTAGAGDGFVAVDRFLPEQLSIRVGQTVVWTNPDPVTPHVVTFGPEPLDPVPPAPLPAALAELAFLRAVGVDPDPPGPPQPRHATIAANPVIAPVSSGVFGSTSPRPTFSVTFTAPGRYAYTCPLHDEFGMQGTIIVTPASP